MKVFRASMVRCPDGVKWPDGTYRVHAHGPDLCCADRSQCRLRRGLLVTSVKKIDEVVALLGGSGGVAAYLFGFVAPTQVGYVHLVGVRADSRRAGLGRRLYREFETLARHRGAKALKAITTPTNHDSIAFHRALDMSATEVADYSGPGQPRIVFWRDLPSR